MKRVAFATIAGWMVAQALVAGPRSSSSYAVQADTLTVGGRSGSASYTVDASLGEVGGLATAGTPVVAAKSGFAGQLYEVTGTTVTAAASTVNEGATLQLGAWQTLDDATFLALAPGTVSWGVVSGPVTGVSAGGLATAGTVYQDTAATVRGTFGGFTGTLGITVRNVNTDDLGLYAGDGIADDWQVQYFGEGNPLAAPGADATGTGQTNLFKFIAGLNPVDPAARFTVVSEAVTGAPGARKVLFSPWLTDRSYALESTGDFVTWTPVTGAVETNGNVRAVTDAAAGSKRFYRVRITKP